MGATCPHCSKDVAGWVPEDRLSKLPADTREALSQLDTLKAEAEALKAKAEGVEGLKAELAEARTHAQTLSTQHSRQLDVYRHGVTDSEDVADLLAIYERRAPQGVSLGDWLGNKDALPRAVSALLSSAEVAPAAPAPTAAAEVQTAQATPTPAEVMPPNPVINGAAPAPTPASANAGAVTAPPARGMPSASDIASMSIDEYKAHRDTLIAGLTKQPGV